MNNPPPEIWRRVGSYLPYREQVITEALEEPTYLQQGVYDEGVFKRKYEDILGIRDKIYRDDSWRYNYNQVKHIIDTLSNDRYLDMPQFYVYNTVTHFVPEYMTNLDSATVFQIEEAPRVIERIGRLILESLPINLSIRFNEGMDVIYGMFPNVHPSVVNYLVLYLGSRIGAYEDLDLYQALADRRIPVKRVSW